MFIAVLIKRGLVVDSVAELHIFQRTAEAKEVVKRNRTAGEFQIIDSCIGCLEIDGASLHIAVVVCPTLTTISTVEDIEQTTATHAKHRHHSHHAATTHFCLELHHIAPFGLKRRGD